MAGIIDDDLAVIIQTDTAPAFHKGTVFGFPKDDWKEWTTPQGLKVLVPVPEMLIAARAMQACVAILKPKLLEADVKPLGKVVIGTVKGDLHDIGKNLVAMMLEGAGFEIIDLGTDVPPEKFVAAITEHEAEFIGMSALLTTTMPAMRTSIEALKEAGVRDTVKIMIGGAPVTQNYADEIGADIYAPECVNHDRW